MQFIFLEHTTETPLLPVFPISTANLIRYGWWLQYHNVEGGMNSIRNYIGVVCDWQQSLGHEDPRNDWVYKKFRKDAEKHLKVVKSSSAKLALTHELFQPLMQMQDQNDTQQLRNAVSYAILGYTALRRGHLIPKADTTIGRQHLIKWKHVQFMPDSVNPEIVVIMLESGKTRNEAKKDIWWTAIKKCSDESICPVHLLARWYNISYQHEPEQYLLADGPQSIPPTTAIWTRQLRGSLRIMAETHGLDADQFDEKNYSGISFRKFSLSALAKHVHPQILAAHADHKSVETTHKYYVTQSVQERAEHSTLIAKGFS